MAAGTIEKHTRADDIRMDEIKWRINAAIDMRFGGKINHGIKLMLGHQRVHLVAIKNAIRARINAAGSRNKYHFLTLAAQVAQRWVFNAIDRAAAFIQLRRA